MQIFNVIPPKDLAGFIRGLEFKYNNENSLKQFLPEVQRTATEYTFVRGTRSAAEVGRFRAFDTEAGLSKRPGFERITGEVFPIAEKMILTEEERLRLEVARFFQGTSLPQEIIDQVLNDAARLTERIQARIEYARGQVLSTGKVTFTSTETGLVGNVDYTTTGRTINTATASPLWSDTTNATVLADLRAWLQTYRDQNDNEDPGVIIGSKRILDALSLTDDMKNAVTPVGANPTSTVIRPDIMMAYLSAWGIPPILAYETKVLIDGTSTRVLPDNKLIFIPTADVEGFGETMVGVTTDGMDLSIAMGGQISVARGLVGTTYKSFDPNHIWTKVAGLMLPVLKDPQRILVATVL